MLYYLSTFPSFPLDMAAAALSMERIWDVSVALTRENVSITYDEKGEYSFHLLLRDYLYSHYPHGDCLPVCKARKHPLESVRICEYNLSI